MAIRLGAVKRAAPMLAVLLAAVVAGYLLFLRDKTATAQLIVPKPVSVIGEGSEAVGVTADGTVVSWFPLPQEVELPRLSLSEPPADGRLAGPALQQARVLGAAPAALRPHIEGSYYGESGVDVNLRSGIELRFGEASQAEAKWRAAAAVLADPSITALDYVDLHVAHRPAIDGESHSLPLVP